jgi:hypothetical protein
MTRQIFNSTGSSRATHDGKWHIKILGGILLLAVLACFVLIQIRTPYAWLEPYAGFNKSAVQSDVGGMEPVGGTCKSAGDPVSVCKNYSACCGETAVPGNCVCDNPIVKECRANYKRCLDDKYLSTKSMAFIGLGNKAKACESILDSCCKIAGEDQDTNGDVLKKVTMRIPAPDAKVLCSMDSLAACKNTCAVRQDCQAVIMNSVEGKCELYDKPLVDKQKIYMASDGQYLQFEKVARKEGFQGGSGSTARKVCRDFNTECAGNSAHCLCQNPVVLDCRRNYTECLAKPGSTDAICKPMFGACCGILDAMAENVELAQRFVFDDKPDGGRGSSQALLCQPNGLKSLDDCKQQCRLNPDCSYIDSNLALSANEDPNTARYCRLYSGKPTPLTAPTMAPVNQFRTIYNKREVDPDES